MRRFGLLLAFVFVVAPAAHAQDAGQFFDSNGVRIHYVDQGEGEPVVLVHGFLGFLRRELGGTGHHGGARDRRVSRDRLGLPGSRSEWQASGSRTVWVGNGPGCSAPARSSECRACACRGLRHGGLITNKLRASHPERLLTATLGGAGWSGENGEESLSFGELAEALDKSDLSPLLRALAPPGESEPTAAAIATTNAGVFANNDPKALAAVIRGFPQLSQIAADNLRANTVPTLALVGDRDPLIAGVELLASVMSNLDVVEIPGATHMTAFSDAVFIENLVEFLDKHKSN